MFIYSLFSQLQSIYMYCLFHLNPLLTSRPAVIKKKKIFALLAQFRIRLIHYLIHFILPSNMMPGRICREYPPNTTCDTRREAALWIESDFSSGFLQQGSSQCHLLSSRNHLTSLEKNILNSEGVFNAAQISI